MPGKMQGNTVSAVNVLIGGADDYYLPGFNTEKPSPGVAVTSKYLPGLDRLK